MMEFVAGTWTSLPAWLQTTLVALGQILAVTIVVILCVAYLTLAEHNRRRVESGRWRPGKD